MSIGLTIKLTETAQLVSKTVNGFGDRVYSTGASLPCLYRDISRLSQSTNREEVVYDGLLWFDADQADVIKKGQIFYLPAESTYVKVDEIVRAKRLVSTDHSVKFVKCGVSKQRQVS